MVTQEHRIFQNKNIRSLHEYGQCFLKDTIDDEDEAKRCASLLLMHVFSYSHYSDLVVHANDNISHEHIKLFAALLEKKRAGEPVQYIIGKTPFMDLALSVAPEVLIPRPETELLVEHVLDHLKSCRSRSEILDIGTGSGAIAIALAYYMRDVHIDAVDISDKALVLAQKNARAHKIENLVSFYKSDLFNAVPPGKQYTVIVSNPPYVAQDELDQAQAELHWEPQRALVADNDGLAIIEKIINDTHAYLQPWGALFLEVGNRHGERVKALLHNKGYTEIKIIKDHSQHDRVACGIKPKKNYG